MQTLLAQAERVRKGVIRGTSDIRWASACLIQKVRSSERPRANWRQKMTAREKGCESREGEIHGQG